MLDDIGPEAPPVTEAMIEAIVRLFYSRVRANATLGPIFAQAIGDDWEPHLHTMFDFWSSMLLGTGRYSGRPRPKHMAIRDLVRPADFDIWLTMFRASATEIAGPETAALFISRAERIGESFKLSMFFDPAAIAPRAG
jgi:hemoglobin